MPIIQPAQTVQNRRGQRFDSKVPEVHKLCPSARRTAKRKKNHTNCVTEQNMDVILTGGFGRTSSSFTAKEADFLQLTKVPAKNGIIY